MAAHHQRMHPRLLLHTPALAVVPSIAGGAYNRVQLHSVGVYH